MNKDKSVEKVLNEKRFKERTSYISLDNVFNKIIEAATEEKVKIKEIIFEKSIDLKPALEKFRNLFEKEIEKKIDELDAIFQDEILSIKEILSKNDLIKFFSSILKKIEEKNWIISYNKILEKFSLVRKYFPFFPIHTAFSQKGYIYFQKPICLIKEIIITISEKTDYYKFNVFMKTEGKHPNVNYNSLSNNLFGSFCLGTNFNYNSIDFIKTDDVLKILYEIECLAKTANLLSAYNKIDFDNLKENIDYFVKSKNEEDLVWK